MDSKCSARSIEESQDWQKRFKYREVKDFPLLINGSITVRERQLVVANFDVRPEPLFTANINEPPLVNHKGITIPFPDEPALHHLSCPPLFQPWLSRGLATVVGLQRLVQSQQV